MGTFLSVEQQRGGIACQSQSWKVPGSNPTDLLSWTLTLTRYEDSADLCVKSHVHSDMDIVLYSLIISDLESLYNSINHELFIKISQNISDLLKKVYKYVKVWYWYIWIAHIWDCILGQCQHGGGGAYNGSHHCSSFLLISYLIPRVQAN